MVATFKVERRWKGAAGKMLRVRTCGTQTSICTCGTDFRLGASSIVFAVGEPLGTGSRQRTTEYQRIATEPGARCPGVEDLVSDLDRLAERRGAK